MVTVLTKLNRKPTTMLERGIRLPSKWNTSTPITPSTAYAPVIRNTSGVLTKAQMELYSRKSQNTRSVITHHRPMADRKPSRWTGRISAKEKSYRNHSPKKKETAVASTSSIIIKMTFGAMPRFSFIGFREPILFTSCILPQAAVCGYFVLSA